MTEVSMIIFLFGEDTFRSRQKLRELKDKFIREIDPSKNSLVVIDGEKATLSEVNEQISPASFFSKKRMAVIENIFSNKDNNFLKELEDFFAKKDSDENIIIIWEPNIRTKKKGNKDEVMMTDKSGNEKALLVKQKKMFEFLKKQKYVQEFQSLSNIELGRWTKKETESRGGRISNQAINHLISLVGSDLWQINNEIDKLVSYKLAQSPKLVKDGDAPSIEINDIDLLVRGQINENIFALTDAISNKNKSLAAKLIEDELEAGAVETYLLTMIIRQFKILLQIRQALDLGQTSRKIISSLKLHPFVVQKSINQVRNFQINQLKAIVNRLVQIDAKMKTGKGDIKTELDLLVVGL